MAERATFTIEEENYQFLVKSGGRNRSAFINRLLKEERRRMLAKKLLKANREETDDLNYQSEIAEWDSTLLDGIE